MTSTEAKSAARAMLVGGPCDGQTVVVEYPPPVFINVQTFDREPVRRFVPGEGHPLKLTGREIRYRCADPTELLYEYDPEF